ncbi:hypothetical protein GOP47_0018086 [Adiantum capillus-veneris]|uniref:DNA polymerase n=1 Tax=Adiantum capillus-veneris TaxID=13818 RepID=A0A9D4UGL8_ADICA|nr:hypothetical protein GOP47_0018086 [Adiantum capillus-veneris]
MEGDTTAPSCSKKLLSLRVVTLDYYMAPPLPELDACYSSLLGQPIAEVPVVRVFGTTLAGQKMCLHLHKAFPYFFVPYDEDLPQDVTCASTFVRNLASAIEKALKLASNFGAKRQHVYSCSLVRGRKFYGFHSEEQLFVKIVLYYPQEVPRLSELLLGGGILNRRFQPYESHIPFLLQVMIDYNLSGMGHVHLSDIKFRQPVLKNEFINICTSKSKLKNMVSLLTKHVPSSGSSTLEARLAIGNLMEMLCRRVDRGEEAQSVLPEKQSTCELEGDTCVEAIMNWSELSYIPLEKAAPDVKMVQSLIPIWDELNVTRSTDVFMKERDLLSNYCGHAAKHREKFDQMLQRPLGDADKACKDDVHEDFNISQESSLKSNALLLCTQAAHSKNSLSRKHNSEDFSRSLSMDSRKNTEEKDVLLNEELIRHQLTQSSQDTDEEAVELLKWMISSQQDGISTGYGSDSEEDNEMSWSQVFQRADVALAKVISDYEVCSQQECQEIIDCFEGEEKGNVGSHHNIPQFEGSFDEEMPDKNFVNVNTDGVGLLHCRELEKSSIDETALKNTDSILHCNSKQKNGWGPVPVKHPLPHLILTGQENHGVGILHEGMPIAPEKDLKELQSEAASGLSEHSVRDLMRSKRTRRQHTHTMAAENRADLATANNVHEGTRVINTGGLAGGCCNVTLVSPTFSSKKESESREHSSRFGPLPLKRLDLSDNSLELKLAVKGELGTESCHRRHDEVTTGEYLAYSKLHSQSFEVLGCKSSDYKDANETQACEVVDEIEVVSAGKQKEELFQSSSPTHQASPPCPTVLCPDVVKSKVASNNLAFWKKPPTAEHLSTTFQNYNLPSANHGEVFYGNAEDLPNQPTVMAGMLFKVCSKGVDNLPSFQFGRDIRGACLSSVYLSETAWAPCVENDAAILPSHFCNDGTALFLLSPVKPPPKAAEVSGWLRTRELQKVDLQQNDTTYVQSANCSEDNEEMFAQSDDATQSNEVFKPSSPNYDETFAPPFSSKDMIQSVYPPLLQNEEGSLIINDENVSEDCSSSKKDSCSGALLKERGSKGDVSQISGPTADNHFTPLSQAGFRDPASIGRGQQISMMSIEAFACTRGDLRPDPRYDAIKSIVMILQSDFRNNQLPTSPTLVLLNDDNEEEIFRNRDGLIGCEVVTVRDETSLLHMFVWFVRMYDPDMLVGWEIQGYSLGFLAERAANLGLGLLREISRLPANRNLSCAMGNSAGKEMKHKLSSIEKIVEQPIIDGEWGRTHGSGICVDGRIVLNLWRIMRSEIKLGIYTLEAVAEAVLKRKVPLVSWRTLTQWFTSGSGQQRHLCLEYYMNRARLSLQIMDQLDLVNRTSELARVFGIDFFSVLSRGSQYRVESMMLRLAHSQNFLLISPSRQQVAAQPAMQCLPLVMEPESRFYTDPVIVLDFQSLYPSMMIAYNLCYSTCLGKIVLDNPKVLGVASLNLDKRNLKDLKDSLIFTPNGVMFTSARARPGVLPRLLEEILSTRIMVKESIKKLLPNQKVLKRVLNARQLALKLISNVTYGYTAAGFSGRMPCAELADSIVQSGRYTLESAINIVNTNAKWNARVVYGDTDSMFVLLKGCTRLEAFKIGEEIAEAITKLNPHPVTLKMEKVYHPCVLLSKKRYVGYSYENVSQVTPKFDAKGIETVRRDSCGAVSKTLEKSLRILFETHDISQVKAYLQRQWQKIMSGRISFRDFIFAKEVRLGTYSARASVLPPAAIVATKAMVIDPRAEPHYGERIPYVVVHGEPCARLVDMVVDPHELVNTSSFRLHDVYYITKQIIPALQRVFGLIGVDLSAWYNEMPRVFRPPSTKRSVSIFPPSRHLRHSNDGLEGDGGQTKFLNSKRTIDLYYLSQHCIVCGDLIPASSYVCENCFASRGLVGTSLCGRLSCLQKQFKHLLAICRHCGGGNEEDMEEGLGCISLACSVFYERTKVQKECRAAATAANQCGFTML